MSEFLEIWEKKGRLRLIFWWPKDLISDKVIYCPKDLNTYFWACEPVVLCAGKEWDIGTIAGREWHSSKPYIKEKNIWTSGGSPEQITRYVPEKQAKLLELVKEHY